MVDYNKFLINENDYVSELLKISILILDLQDKIITGSRDFELLAIAEKSINSIIKDY